jgi:hypothetical protein
MIFLSDDDVEMFGEIVGNMMFYDGKQYKIIRATNDGYYVNHISDVGKMV